MVSAPSSVPKMSTLPPESSVPPTATAAMASSSMFRPILAGSAAEIMATFIRPASPAHAAQAPQGIQFPPPDHLPPPPQGRDSAPGPHHPSRGRQAEQIAAQPFQPLGRKGPQVTVREHFCEAAAGDK